MNFEIVVAYEKDTGIIGTNGTLPWRLSDDLKHFQQVTKSVPRIGLMNAVIMGRKTWDSLDRNKRPLPERLNIVVTRTPSYSSDPLLVYVESLDEALKTANMRQMHKTFVIGGGEIYEMAMKHPSLGCVHATEVTPRKAIQNPDAHFPIQHLKKMKETNKQTFNIEDETKDVKTYSFVTYQTAYND